MNGLQLAGNAVSCSRYSFGRREHDDWHRVLDEFEDASVFQTIPFCSARPTTQSYEHLVVGDGLRIIAAAQVRLTVLPFSGTCIAYVLSGPLFRQRGKGRDWGVLSQALEALRKEYVVKRKGVLRVNPLVGDDQRNEWVPVFEAAGYTCALPAQPPRTIVMDLARSIDDLRKGLDQKWRNCLNRAERNGLEVIEGSDDAQFELFLRMYREMLTRKHLAEPGDVRTFRAMQSMLPARHKMHVIVVVDRGEPSAGAIISAIGQRGLFLFGATSDSGLRNKASYLAQWRAIQWLKHKGCAEYDLHGVNAASNPGVYAFKTGLCGRNGKEVALIGPFEAYSGMKSRLVLGGADFANRQYKRMKNVYGRYRGFRG